MQNSDYYSKKPALDYLFYPKSIAVVGVSNDISNPNAGRDFTESLIEAGFRGKIYPVGSKGGKIFGLRLYPSIKDIPEKVDYAILSIPAQYTPELILDCATKGVKTIHMFTAGFSEIADKEGKQLELQITNIAHRKGIRIIGPNCMGLYHPKTGLSFNPDFPKQGGSVGFFSQSGGNSSYAIREAAMRGVYFSKVISYGNGCDLNESDFLEYLTQDSETKLIADYMEGVKQGTRFVEVLKQAAKAKPVIIYKAGSTESGTRAVASHTGAIAGSNKTWESLLNQVGAIQVHSMEELVDVIVLFKYMSPLTGRNTALIGLGGGAVVQATDECSRAGLILPPLPAEIRQKLEDIYTSEAGSSFRNPVDMYWGKKEVMAKTISIVADYDQIDLLIIEVVVGFNPKAESKVLQTFVESILSLSEAINKRTAVVLRLIGLARFEQTTLKIQTALWEAGFPIYPSASRAANAINKFIQYHHRQQILKNS